MPLVELPFLASNTEEGFVGQTWRTMTCIWGSEFGEPPTQFNAQRPFMKRKLPVNYPDALHGDYSARTGMWVPRHWLRDSLYGPEMQDHSGTIGGEELDSYYYNNDEEF